MSKYRRNMDEETLSKSLDDVRKSFCDFSCDSCPWSMGEEKCLLITAENHISDGWRRRYRNMMRRYGLVSEFLLHADNIRIGDCELSQVDEGHWVLYRDGIIEKEVRDVNSSLELVRMMDMRRTASED